MCNIKLSGASKVKAMNQDERNSEDKVKNYTKKQEAQLYNGYVEKMPGRGGRVEAKKEAKDKPHRYNDSPRVRDDSKGIEA